MWWSGPTAPSPIGRCPISRRPSLRVLPRPSAPATPSRRGGHSGKPLPRGLARDTQRSSNLGPTHFARSKDLDHPLELITLALDRVLDRSKVLQQTFGRQLF